MRGMKLFNALGSHNSGNNRLMMGLSLLSAFIVKILVGLATPGSIDFFNLCRGAAFTDWTLRYHGWYTFSFYLMNLFYRLWLLAPISHPPVEEVLNKPLMSGDFLIFRGFMKAPLILFDLAVGVLLYKLASALSGSGEKSYLVMALWLFNPYVIAEVEITAQIDVVSTCLVVLGALLFLRGRYLLAGLSIGVGVIARFYPLILIPLFLLLLRDGRAGKLKFLVGACTPILTAISVLYLKLGAALPYMIWRIPVRGAEYVTEEEFLWFFGYIAKGGVYPNDLGVSFVLAMYIFHIIAIRSLWNRERRLICDSIFIALLTYFGFAFWNKYHSVWIVPFITLEYGVNRETAGEKLYTMLFVTFFICSYIYGSLWSHLGASYIPPYNEPLRSVRDALIGVWKTASQGQLLETFNRSILAAVSTLYICYITLRNVGFSIPLSRPPFKGR